MHPLDLTEQEIRQRIWMELERAPQDRHHEWRTPTLATVEKDGVPNARTVVLRHADPKLCSLQIYTDSRSPKVAELIHEPTAMLVFWSKRLNWQLRARVDISVHTSGQPIEVAWDRISQSAAAGDYLSPSAPGDALPVEPVPPGDTTRKHHLAILVAQIQQIDWLELRHGGHRRALLGANSWEWRVP